MKNEGKVVLGAVVVICISLAVAILALSPVWGCATGPARIALPPAPATVKIASLPSVEGRKAGGEICGRGESRSRLIAQKVSARPARDCAQDWGWQVFDKAGRGAG